MQSRTLGFTLIEILVVIVIISITAATSFLAFGDMGGDRKALISAEQFINYVKLIQQRALLEMSTLGIGIKNNSYQTYRFESTWQLITKPSLFRPRLFPGNVAITFLSDNGVSMPNIIIDASGNMTAFKLIVRTINHSNVITISGFSNGSLQLKRHD